MSSTSNDFSSTSILEARNLGWFLDDQDRWLWRRVNFAIHPSDRISLAGPSGAGKSMLLRALAFLSPVAEGTVLWHGTAVAPHVVPIFRSRVCYVPQRAMLIEGTVRDNLTFPYQFKSHSHHVRDESIWRRWLQELGRDVAFLDRRSDELSGGEAQIVALIRVLQFRPEILLLDEPTSAMDPISAEALESLLFKQCDETAAAYLWITHDARQAVRVGKTQLEIREGELREVIT